MSARLTLDEVACIRGGRLLFEGLNLILAPGAAALVRGPNGTGKSSLLRLVAGLLRPASGAIDRADATLADEHLALDERQRLRDALRFWAKDIDAGMSAMGLLPLARVPVRMLSTGQRLAQFAKNQAGHASATWTALGRASG